MAGIDVAIRLIGEAAMDSSRAKLPGLIESIKPGLEGLKTIVNQDSVLLTARTPNNLKKWQLSVEAQADKLQVNQEGNFLTFTHNDGSQLNVAIKTGIPYMDKFMSKGAAQEVSIYNDAGRQVAAHFENEELGVFGSSDKGAAHRLHVNEVSPVGHGLYSDKFITPLGAGRKESSIAGFVKDSRSRYGVSTPGLFGEGDYGISFTFNQPGTVHLSDLNPNLAGVVKEVSSVDIPRNPFLPIELKHKAALEERTLYAQVPYSKITNVEQGLLQKQASSIGLPKNSSLDSVRSRMYQIDFAKLLGVPSDTPATQLMEMIKGALK